MKNLEYLDKAFKNVFSKWVPVPFDRRERGCVVYLGRFSDPILDLAIIEREGCQKVCLGELEHFSLEGYRGNPSSALECDLHAIMNHGELEHNSENVNGEIEKLIFSSLFL